METELVRHFRGRKESLWRELMTRAGLEADGDSDVTALVWDDETLVAAGSRKENLLKCIAVSPDRQGQGLTADIITALRQDAFLGGYRHLFLYTKPENRQMFGDLFFYPIAETDQVLLMEDKPQGIREFLQSLPAAEREGRIGAAVMNCDPFTLGHRHLIQTAAAECDRLYVFVLSEDKGYFSAADRLAMVRAGTEDLSNVTVLLTGPYLISSATFPTYFLKDRDRAAHAHFALDIALFARYFAPYFGIKVRYVGTEPLSALTEQYNAALAQELPKQGIALRQIPRLEREGAPISASHVRQLLKAGDHEAAKALLPQTAFRYLQIHNLL